MVELYVNGVLSCVSKQMYGNRRGGYVEPVDGSIIESMLMPPGSHISDAGVCKDWGEVRAGDKLKTRAYYDETKHMQMKGANGQLEKQMGIMWAWLGPKDGEEYGGQNSAPYAEQDLAQGPGQYPQQVPEQYGGRSPGQYAAQAPG
jgi:hypothetical protein